MAGTTISSTNFGVVLACNDAYPVLDDGGDGFGSFAMRVHGVTDTGVLETSEERDCSCFSYSYTQLLFHFRIVGIAKLSVAIKGFIANITGAAEVPLNEEFHCNIRERIS